MGFNSSLPQLVWDWKALLLLLTHAALYTRTNYEKALLQELTILELMFITMSLPLQVCLTNYAKLTTPSVP
jgi:hypothetical protein